MIWKLEPFPLSWSSNSVAFLTLKLRLVFGRMLQCSAAFCNLRQHVSVFGPCSDFRCSNSKDKDFSIEKIEKIQRMREYTQKYLKILY